MIEDLKNIELQLGDKITFDDGSYCFVNPDGDYKKILMTRNDFKKIERYEPHLESGLLFCGYYLLETIWERKEENNLEELTKEQELDKIYEMIASGEIPKEVYDKYLSKTKIGFMSKDEIKKYFEKSTNDDIEEVKHRYIYGLSKKEEEIDDRVSEIEEKLNEVIKKVNELIKKVNELNKESK